MAQLMYVTFDCFLQVGYGDITPVSPQGRKLSALLAFTGVFFYAMLASVFIYRFHKYYSYGRFRRTRHTQAVLSAVTGQQPTVVEGEGIGTATKSPGPHEK